MTDWFAVQKLRSSLTLFLWAAVASAAPLTADEGMWTFDNPPTKQLQQTYGFTPTPEWLERVRLASVRFNDGGSGSFVSGEGLMITNHHVGRACIQNVSSAEHDYAAEGFYAASRDKEIACPGYEVNVLMSTEDVTARVLAAVKAEMNDKAAGEARKAERARIEKDCNEKSGLRCDVIELYQGGEYHLYRYKKYTDVRLVFAPEQQIAFFGGDPDNFTYPRHDLDVSFFRAYEEGKPVRSTAFLPWSAGGTKEDDLVLVSGNPGSTSRLETMAQLESRRDVELPGLLGFIKRRLTALAAYTAKSPENDRRAKNQVFSLDNGRKAFEGRLKALQDAKAMAAKAAAEKDLKAKVAADAALEAKTGDPWTTIAAAQKQSDARLNDVRFVSFSGSRLLGIAGQIVRHVVETKKPNEVRLEEYRESGLASLENRLFSKAPIYEDLEEATLTDQLQQAVEALGKDHAFVKAALQGKTPAAAAHEAVSGTKLEDVEARKALVQGGQAAVDASSDPMIVLARRIDPLAREVRKWREDQIDAVISRAGEKLAGARWKVFGKAVPPDATFTLRLSYGTVKAYPAEGTIVAPYTTYYGLYDRWASWGGKAPWDLPKRYVDKKSAVDLATPLDFVSTCDIIGGNSGSPTIDRKGEFVGIIFDGNIESLALDYFYTDEQSRAVSVDARGILEALKKVYEAGPLVEELTKR
jgi:hypothetical protein